MSDFKIVKLLDPISLTLTGPNFQGEYVSGTTYQAGMSVSYNGSSYVALQATTGNVPTNTTYWQVLAAKGDVGAGGVAFTCRNSTGTAIQAFRAVYVSGSTGNEPNITLALGDNDTNSSKTFGVTSQVINNNSNGTVVHNGEIDNLNTSAYTAGDLLWLSPTTPGLVTTTRPTAPDHAVFVGYIVRAHPTQGKIIVTIQNGFELQELHDVLINGITNGQVIQYESATQLWKNHTLTKTDVGLGNVPNTDATNPANITQTASYRFVTDTEKSTWNGKQNALGFTPEDVANKSTTTTLGTSNTLYPTQNAVKTYVDTAISGATIPDATTLVKGKIKLAGDLSGTADLPTVPGLANKINSSEKGAASGVATLDTTSKMPLSQLPTITTLPSLTLPGSQVSGDIPGKAANVNGVVAPANGGLGTSAAASFTGVVKASSGLFSASTILNVDISSAASIGREKLASGSANRIVVNNSSGVMTDANAITPSRVLVSDTNGIPASSFVTSSELGYVSGVTASIQSQINSKQNSLGFTAENISNKSTTTTLGTSDTLYPTQNAVKTYVDTTVNKFRAEFVFQPGGTAGGNVYTSWSLLHTQLVATPGNKIVFFDDRFSSPCVIPSGDYDFTNTTLSANIYNDVGAYVRVSSGVEFTGLGEVSNILLEFQTTSTVQSFIGESTINFRNCIIQSSGTSAPFEAEGASLAVNLQEKAIFINNGASVFKDTNGAGISFNVYSNSEIGINTVSSTVSTYTVFNIVDPSCRVYQVQTGLLGTVVYENLSIANQVAYSPENPGDWYIDEPNNAKDAFDLLAATQVNKGTNQSVSGVKTFTGNTLIANNTASIATIGGSSSSAIHQINGGVNYTTRTVTSNLTIDTTKKDFIIYCNQTSAINLTLPAPTNGRAIIIKDISGNAATNNITILRNASEKIEGVSASYIFQTNFGTLQLVSNGTDWWIL